MERGFPKQPKRPKEQKLKQKITIVIEREEDPKAGYSVYCPDLPGCFSNGGTKEEALTEMREAIALHLESLKTVRGSGSFGGLIVPQVIRFLQGQCFVPRHKSSNHLTVLKTVYEGKRPVSNVMITLPVHRSPDLGRKLILRILKAAGCSPEDFLSSGKN